MWIVWGCLGRVWRVSEGLPLSCLTTHPISLIIIFIIEYRYGGKLTVSYSHPSSLWQIPTWWEYAGYSIIIIVMIISIIIAIVILSEDKYLDLDSGRPADKIMRSWHRNNQIRSSNHYQHFCHWHQCFYYHCHQFHHQNFCTEYFFVNYGRGGFWWSDCQNIIRITQKMKN